MTTTSTGRNAEDIVAQYLAKNGFAIIVQNWRTRRCEIDIVATKKNIAYFVEVKYRKSSAWGDGLDAITVKKQQQMIFASDIWVQTNNWQGDSRLLVASLSGEPPVLNELIEL
jgi:uncharacterized protein (TIGR00252 family)